VGSVDGCEEGILTSDVLLGTGVSSTSLRIGDGDEVGRGTLSMYGTVCGYVGSADG
jgi:hypothetical protein